MTHPIQIILTRQLAGYLNVPLFLVDPEGNLLFYNEPRTSGRRPSFRSVRTGGGSRWSRFR